MKIAYCIAGQPRYFDGFCFSTVKKKILEMYDIDVFFHTWWSEEEVGTTQVRSPWAGANNYTITADCPQKLVNQYKPKLYKIEPTRTFQANDLNCSDKNFWIRSGRPYWYSVQQAARMKMEYERKQGFRYDLVIMTRFDLLIGVLMDLHTISPEVFTVSTVSRQPDMCSDFFTATNSTNFDKIYLNIFDKIPEYINNSLGKPMNEHMLYFWVRKTFNIPVVRSKKMFIQIARESEEPDWIEKQVWLEHPDQFNPEEDDHPDN